MRLSLITHRVSAPHHWCLPSARYVLSTTRIEEMGKTNFY